MKKKLNVVFGLSLMLVTSMLFSCSRENGNCTTCDDKPEGQKLVELPFPDGNLSINCDYYTREITDQNTYEFGNSNLDNDKFQV